MLLMNGYLRKAQHDENNLNIEVTVEVISDFYQSRYLSKIAKRLPGVAIWIF